MDNVIGDKKKRCVIVAGADIHDYDRLKKLLKSDDFYIFADSGLKHRVPLGVQADYIIGDFDSYSGNVKEQYPNSAIKTLPCEKDDTDTFYAIKEGLRLGFEDFLLLGVIGGRLDHSLANISCLVMLSENGVNAIAADDYSLLRVIRSGGCAEIDASSRYFSLISLSQTCTGVSIKNAKYPLENATIGISFQYAISNECTLGSPAAVFLKNGVMLVVSVI